MKPQPSVERVIWSLCLAIAAIRIGYGAVVPTLPLYVQEHGLSTAMVAAMTNAYLLTNTLLQGPAGHLSDRLGRLPVLVAGATLYAVAAALFLIDGGPWYYVVLRALEGVGAAAFGPVARAYAADMVPVAERGRTFGYLMSADMAGLLIGPVIGGVAQSIGGMKAPFFICAVLGFLAVAGLLTLRGSESRREESSLTTESPATTRSILTSTAFWAVALPGLGVAYLSALYTVVWGFYMQDRGGTLWHVNLSWTLFALPMVLLMAPAGRLADRYGRTLLVAVGGAICALTTLGYGLAGSPWPLLALGLVDGIGTAMLSPASQAFMADVTPPGVRGKFIGLVGSLGTGATVVAATIIGVAYERLSPFWLFAVGALLLGASTAGAVVLMRSLEARTAEV